MKKNSRPLVLGSQFLLAIASALLLALSFPDFDLEFLSWIGLVPLFFAIEAHRPTRAFLVSYLAGVIFFLSTIYWLIHVTLPGMVLMVLYLALYFGAFGLIFNQAYRITHRLNPRGAGLVFLFLVPAAWCTLELIRSHFLTGFGWVLLGHSQSYNLPIIQIADIAGVYGVSFLIVMVNTVIFLTIKGVKKKEVPSTCIAITFLCIFFSLAYGIFRLNNIFTGERLRVAVIQGNIPQDEKWDSKFRETILRKYENLTEEATKEKADLVIWPETSVPGFLETEDDLLDRIKALALRINTPLLVGTVREDQNGRETIYYNSATLLSKDGRIVDRYDKVHLVPFGEYIPFKDALSFVGKFAPIPIGDCSAGKEYKVFDFFMQRNSKNKDFNWQLIKKVQFSCLICFEDIFPDLTREFVKKNIDFLVNITNDAWYKKTSAAYQHAQNSIFRAVENRIDVVRAANTGLSCFIDQKGKIVGAVEADGEELFVSGYKIHEIVLARTKTFYTAYGDIFAYICVAFTLAFVFTFKRISDFKNNG